MKITGKFSDGYLRLNLIGELDHHAAKKVMYEIGEFIDRYLPMNVTINMSGIVFMDSSGIAVILNSMRRMRELDGKVQVINVPPQAMRVLLAAGVERLVSITPKSKEA